jgi:hypothetical protein
MKKLLFLTTLVLLLVAGIVSPGLAADAAVPATDVISGGWVMALVVALLAVSEALAYIPALKSNSVFQIVINILGKIAELVGAKKPSG